MVFVRLNKGVIYGVVCLLIVAATGVHLQFLDAVTTALRADNVFPVCSVERYGNPWVSLSFDLERGEENVDEILAILESYQVKSTFFVVGEWAKEHPALIHKIAEQGHEIMSHSETNLDLTHQSATQIRAELIAANEVIEELTGNKPFLFRIPHGKYDETVLQVCEEEGMIPILWSIDSGDLDGRNAIASANDVTAQLRAGEIVLFHNDASRTPIILQRVLAYLDETELKSVPIGVMIHRENWTVDENGRQVLKGGEISTLN